MKKAIEQCREIGKANGISSEVVETFIANHKGQSDTLTALNRLTGKVEKVRTAVHIERLLLAFAHSLEHQTQ